MYQSDSTASYLEAARAGDFSKVVSLLDLGKADVASANAVRTSHSKYAIDITLCMLRIGLGLGSRVSGPDRTCPSTVFFPI